MSQIKLGNLVSKLDAPLKAALEAGAGAAMAQTVAAIEIEHWFIQLLNADEQHLTGFLKNQRVDSSSLVNELTLRVERLRTGIEGQPTISPALSELMESAWMQASVNYGQQQITSLHLLLALIQADSFGLKNYR
ncbi:ClpB protein [Vibrio astriarenae]|nr:ClpB protein [Vibrio sp. C7]